MKLLDWLSNPEATKGVYYADDAPVRDWPKVSYAQIAVEIARIAHMLSEYKLSRGDVVSILFSQPQEFIPAFFGTLIAGGTASPIATPLTFGSVESYRHHLKKIFTFAKPTIVLVENHLYQIVADVVAKLDARIHILTINQVDLTGCDEYTPKKLADHILLQFTSGSTGTPKAVQITPENLDANIDSITQWISNVSPWDMTVSWLPFYHDMGLIGSLLTSFYNGVDLKLLTPIQFVRSPLRWVECMGTGGTISVCPSFGFSYAASKITPEQLEGLDFSPWRIAILGAERVNPISVQKFINLTAPFGLDPAIIVGAYGLAEATLAVTGSTTNSPLRLVELESTSLNDGQKITIARETIITDENLERGNWVVGCGGALVHTEIDIIDENGTVLPELHHGQIRIRGAGISQGYRDFSGQSFTHFDKNNLYSGDSGFIYKNELYVIGRIGDSIKIRGSKLYAEDIDAKALQVPGLKPGKVVSLLGSLAGNDAIFVLSENNDADWVEGMKKTLRLISGDSIVIAFFKGERGCIERTSSGKPQRKAMWEQLLHGDFKAELLYTNWDAISDKPWPLAYQLA